ncbi:hypothetical protein GCM10027051_04410 [Niabella terrae]
MRKLLQRLLRSPILWIAERFSSRPDKDRIYEALSRLYERIAAEGSKKGPVIPMEDFEGRFIIFSDQHKGNRNGADDFMTCEANYLAALDYYNREQFCFINLGDGEELWENTLPQIKKANKAAFQAEAAFLNRNAFVKVFGNHDLYWANDPLAAFELEAVYGRKLKVREGVLLTSMIRGRPLNIFCTHGHQGDANSDGNWLTKFFIARIWGPLQAYLQINPNEPSNDVFKKTIHNEIMYEWSATQRDLILITGHTHQPVFESLTHIERLHRQLKLARTENDEKLMASINDEVKTYRKRFDTLNADYSKILPTYFNTGCCCFSDGDITGIEIQGGFIRLIKWHRKTGQPSRMVLEERSFEDLLA